MDDSEEGWADVGYLHANLEAWPAGEPLPTDPEELIEATVHLVLADLLCDTTSAVWVVRFARNGASVWMLDSLKNTTLTELMRGIAAMIDPPPFAMMWLQPKRAPGDPTVRGVHMRGMFGDELVDLHGDVEGLHGPAALRRVASWQLREMTVTQDRDRWMGVPPAFALRLPPANDVEA